MGEQVTHRTAGTTAVAGASIMLAGAVCWGASGTDLWAALAAGTITQHRQDAHQAMGLLTANLLLWVLGVLLMSSAGSMMARLCTRRTGLAVLGRTCMLLGAAVAIPAFVLMYALALFPEAEPSPAHDTVYRTIGWAAAHMDDIATVLIVGLGPLALATAGHGAWAPGWLRTWGWLAGAVGLIGLAAAHVRTDHPLVFLIIPFGIGWMIAAGVVLIKVPKRERT